MPKKIFKNKIYILAGHSKNDPGAVYNGVRESELTIALRDALSAKLVDMGAIVIKDNDSHSLSETINSILKTVRARDILIDLHFNAAHPAATGCEVFVKANGASLLEQALARDLCDTISKTLKIRNRGVKFDNQSQHSRLGVLYTGAESVLVEVCFLTNENDVKSYHENFSALVDNISACIWKHML